MEKKKKSVFAKIMTAIFSLIFIFILAVVGLSIFVGVKYHVNVISVTSHLVNINKEVDLEKIAPNQFGEEDLTNAENKQGQISSTTKTKFNEKELGALAQNLVGADESTTKLLLGETDLSDFGAEIVSIDFSNINWVEWHNGSMDISAVIKIQTQALKDKYFANFPASLFKSTIPNELYMVATFKLVQSEDGNTLSDQTLAINNLEPKQTEQLFLTLDMFAGVGTQQEYAEKFAEAISNVLFADTNSLYASLEVSGAKTYVFESTETADNMVIYNVEPTETRTITYNNTKGAENSNIDTYNITHNTIILAALSANGYEFLGWFDDEDNKVISINAEEMVNINLTAKWQIIEYTLSLNLRGGEIEGSYAVAYAQEGDTATIKFTIESATFSLPSPTKTIMVDSLPVVCNFKGWLSQDGENLEVTVAVNAGTYRNLSYTAYYQGETKTVSVVVDNHTYKTVEVDVGETLDQETFFDASTVGMSGYSVENWYANSGLSTPFDFEAKIVEDTSIYGTWNYITDHVYFYPYIDAFNAAQSSNSLHISSREMLFAYADYVMFFEITNSSVVLTFDYSISTDNTGEEIVAVISEYQNATAYSGYGAFGYFATMSKTSNRLYTTNYSAGQASKVVSTKFAEHELAATNQPLVQQDFAFKFANVSTREGDCNFNVDKVQKTINVSTSEQLVWVLENGYKPVCKAGSNAEDIYNKAKTVLRSICDDSMSDVEKLERIYQWIVFNTQYDRLAATLSDSHSAAYVISNNSSSATFFKYYDSWFAEGVFNSKIAVCEGFAKALLIMARIEGIPCVYVTGNGHAWNKVYVDGKWYVVDATHGNPLNTTEGVETLNYSEFMITDAVKANRGYSTADYADFEATTAYRALADWELSYNSHNFDLYANDQAEFTNILKYAAYIKNNSTILSGATCYTFNVCFDNASQFSSWLNSSRSAAGISVSDLSYSSSNLTDCVMYSISLEVA